MKMPFLFLMAAILGVCPVAAADRISFMKLAPGDEVAVDYQSRGCFHASQHELVFSPSEVEVTAIESKWLDAKQEYGEPTRKMLGKIALTEDDLMKLDNLLFAYTTAGQSYCTTVNNIEVTLKQGSEIIAKDEYADSSCTDYKAENVLVFHQLIARLDKDE